MNTTTNTLHRRDFCLLAAQATISLLLLPRSANGTGILSNEIEVDLSLPRNSALNTVGGAVYVTHPSESVPIIVVRNTSSKISAFLSKCTHRNLQVDLPAQNKCICPAHGAEFDLEGKVLKGPATKDLEKYSTRLEGNKLIISLSTATGIQTNNQHQNRAQITYLQQSNTIILSWENHTETPERIELIDARGVVVRRYPIASLSKITIPTRNLPSGSYKICMFFNNEVYSHEVKITE